MEKQREEDAERRRLEKQKELALEQQILQKDRQLELEDQRRKKAHQLSVKSLIEENFSEQLTKKKQKLDKEVY